MCKRSASKYIKCVLCVYIAFDMLFRIKFQNEMNLPENFCICIRTSRSYHWSHITYLAHSKENDDQRREHRVKHIICENLNFTTVLLLAHHGFDMIKYMSHFV